MDCQSLEKLLWAQIPLAKAMHVRVLKADEKEVEVACGLALNHNHLGSAFGGSLSALMTLAAYCRIFHMINGTGHVLLKSNATKFLRPVNEDLRAVCFPPLPEVISKFLNTYQKKGTAQLSLTSQIVLKDGSIASRMSAEFVGRAE
jgi:thioesterase domain-containing protein